MSLSEYSSAPFSGIKRKPSRINLPEPAPEAVETLANYFERSRDLEDKDVLLSQVKAYRQEGGSQNGFEVVGNFTRKQRSDARLLGFNVNYAGSKP